MTHFGIATGAHGLHLCHVLSWYNIRCILDGLLKEAYELEAFEVEGPNKENYVGVQNFIIDLFELDAEAVVNFGAWFPPLTPDCWNDPNKQWFEQEPAKMPHVNGTKYTVYIHSLCLCI